MRRVCSLTDSKPDCYCEYCLGEVTTALVQCARMSRAEIERSISRFTSLVSKSEPKYKPIKKRAPSLHIQKMGKTANRKGFDNRDYIGMIRR